MKSIILAIAFCFLVHSGFSQKLTPTKVFKVDSTILSVYGLKFQGNQVTYRLASSATSKIVSVPRREISRIRYSSGKEEIITIRQLPVPQFTLRTAFTGVKISLLSTDQKGSTGSRPDRIYMKDRGIIECRIIEIGDKEVRYVVITDSSQQIRIIKRKEVDKVERNNVGGNTPMFSQATQVTPTKVALSEKQSLPEQVNISQSSTKQDAAENKNEVVATQPKIIANAYTYSAITLGVEGSQILPFGSSQWTNEREGLGLKGAIGGSVRYTKRLNRILGLTTEIGFTKWESEYRWKNEEELLYTYSIDLSRLSVSAGPKLYIGKALYVLAKANAEGLQLRQVGYDSESISESDMVQRKIYWGGSGTLGYELKLGSKFIVDASVSYNYFAKPIPVLDYAYPPNSPLHLLSFRVGFGFISYRTLNK